MLVNIPTQLTLALVMTVFCCTPAVFALNMSHICALTGDGAKLASGDACNTYYLCSGGLAQLQTCQSPYYFSKDLQQCVPQSQVKCLGYGQDPCEGQAIGTWVGVPGSCSGFYYCSAKGALRSNCPSGENFDPYSQQCKYNANYPCGQQDSAGGHPANVPDYINLCSYIQNGLYFGNPTKCADWNQCVKNVMRTGSCSNNLVFNVNLHTCDYANDWACTQVMNDPDLSGPVASNGGSCTVRGAMKAATSCVSYYLCDGTTFQLQNCAANLYYDPPSQTCVNRLSARNNCDRCAGTTDTFVNQFSTANCRGYLFCQNGVEKSQGVCKSGYFDEVAGACVDGEEPKYACCNPSVDATSTTANPTNSTVKAEATVAVTKANEASTKAPEAPKKATEAVTNKKA